MTFTDADLLAYLDEALPPEAAAEVERTARESESLRQRLAALLERQDQGGHSLGEIWRRRQLSCPTRNELSRYLGGQLPTNDRTYVEFHISVVQCPICEANLADLRQLGTVDPSSDQDRRKRIFESSAGGLRKHPQ